MEGKSRIHQGSCATDRMGHGTLVKGGCKLHVTNGVRVSSGQASCTSGRK